MRLKFDGPRTSLDFSIFGMYQRSVTFLPFTLSSSLGKHLTLSEVLKGILLFFTLFWKGTFLLWEGDVREASFSFADARTGRSGGELSEFIACSCLPLFGVVSEAGGDAMTSFLRFEPEGVSVLGSVSTVSRGLKRDPKFPNPKSTSKFKGFGDVWFRSTGETLRTGEDSPLRDFESRVDVGDVSGDASGRRFLLLVRGVSHATTLGADGTLCRSREAERGLSESFCRFPS